MHKLNLTEIFSPTGYFGKNLPSFEDRPQQLSMAIEIQKLIETCNDGKQHCLIVEAGTGVGKSMAYLVPFIYWAVNENKRVVISTYTKTLQEQLTNKDLPFLKEILPLKFRYSLCVGSENYICLRRYEQMFQYGLFDTRTEVEHLNRISEWLKNTETGLRLELEFEPDDRLWSNICREPDMCLNKKCKYQTKCYYIKSRQEQNKSHILVVNHYLFFANIAAGGKVLPDYDAVVFDEAHNIEEVATQYLGIEISNTGIKYLLDRIYNPNTHKGLITRAKELSDSKQKEIIELVDNVRQNTDVFFTGIVDKLGSETVTKRIRTPHFIENILDIPLEALYNGLKSVIDEVETEEKQHEFLAYTLRFLSVKNQIKTFIEQSLNDYIYWIEITPKTRYIKVTLYVNPVDVSSILIEKVYSVISPIVFTSATLTVNPNGFAFIKERLGLNSSHRDTAIVNVDELSNKKNNGQQQNHHIEIVCSESLFGSPFDYKKNVLIYITAHLPDPSYEFDRFQIQAIEHTKDIIEIFRGRTFILFTSYETLNQACEFLRAHLSGITILKQGEMPRWQMIEYFKYNDNTILLGTNTFWQGVDIPGKALECVIIFKLPFSVPYGPVTEAKIEYLLKHNKDPFKDYQLPESIILLRQGFGRLIRTKTDRGVVVILDPRITTRAYGRLFIDSLPECSITKNIDDVINFYGGRNYD